MERLLEFAGRLHPMLVHLPIGILLIAVVLLLLVQLEKMEVPRPVINLVLGGGSIMAVASCITGYLLSRTGDYDTEAVDLHLWMALFLTMVSLAAWYLHYEYWLRDQVLYLISGVAFFSLVATGHLGASLTHGSSYLTEPFDQSSNEFSVSTVDVQNAIFFQDVISPIFQNRCLGCHGAEKQKGKLRLDQKDFILKGGKTGPAVVAGSAGDSELWERLNLPINDEDHMPPKEKGQLSESEKEVIKLWINSGADFEKKISDLLDENQISVFTLANSEAVPFLPEEDIAAPNQAAIRALQKEGVSVTTVSRESNYLSVNFVSIPKDASRVLPILNEISKNVVWLKLTGCELNADNFRIVSGLSNLRRLSLDDTNTTDSDLESLSALTFLTHLNLKGTDVTYAGVEKLKALPSLNELYLFETKVAHEDRQKLQSVFTKTKIDFGDYQVPTLPTDTSVLNAPKN